MRAHKTFTVKGRKVTVYFGQYDLFNGGQRSYIGFKGPDMKDEKKARAFYNEIIRRLRQA